MGPFPRPGFSVSYDFEASDVVHPPPTTPEDLRIAITLASLSYLAEDESLDQKKAAIRAALTQTSLPTRNEWSLQWGPAEYQTDLWFAVTGRSSVGPPRAAIIVRGTKMNSITSLWQDFTPELVDVPFDGGPAGAEVSLGFACAFERLLQARDEKGNNAIDFCKVLKPGTPIDVIGHSLGGAVAPLLSLYVQREIPTSPVRSFPFAGQATGNAAFADWYVDQFPGQPSRWINRHDVIPMMSAQLGELKETYLPAGPWCPTWVKEIATDFQKVTREYRAIPGASVLDGRLYFRKYGLEPWIQEIEDQHQRLYYMYLTGIAASVIQERLGPSWRPPPTP